MKIAILIIATNRYVDFLDPLIESINKNLLSNHEKHLFVFTDAERKDNENVKYIQIQHQPWPCMTLFRYSIFAKHEYLLDGMDYVYYIDADMRVLMPVGDEILDDVVAVKHFAFWDKPRKLFTFDTNPKSLAYMQPTQGKIYYAGAFQGGKRESYMSIIKKLANDIDIDYSKGIIALWHDESHWNKYLAFNPPTKILSPAYCYGDGWNIPFDKKILSVRKDEKALKI